jgi:hypothetical protein
MVGVSNFWLAKKARKTHLNTTQLQRKDQPEKKEDRQIRKLRRSPECNK